MTWPFVGGATCGACVVSPPQERFFQNSDKSVTPPAHGFDKSRFVRAVVERAPDLTDRGIQPVIEIDKNIRGPKLLLQFVAGNHLIRALQQKKERSKRTFLQWNTQPILAKLSGARIGFVNVKA